METIIDISWKAIQNIDTYWVMWTTMSLFFTGWWFMEMMARVKGGRNECDINDACSDLVRNGTKSNEP